MLVVYQVAPHKDFRHAKGVLSSGCQLAGKSKIKIRRMGTAKHVPEGKAKHIPGSRRYQTNSILPSHAFAPYQLGNAEKVADLEASAEADAKVLVEARNKADEIQRRLKSEKADHAATTGLLEEERARYGIFISYI